VVFSAEDVPLPTPARNSTSIEGNFNLGQPRADRIHDHSFESPYHRLNWGPPGAEASRVDT
jgi:hypothetical protein